MVVRSAGRFVVVLLILPGALAMIGWSVVPQEAGGRDGDIDGVRLWTLPSTADVDPDQCWHSVGSDPDGNIYVSGMDHRTNSGLYQLDVAADTLRNVGDARTASQAVDNWLVGETAEKFHTRPTWHGGVVYVATTDKTDIASTYLSTRGFHWYGYNIESDTFSDLSVSEPGGVGAEHLQILTIAPDTNNNVLYGMSNASAELVRYDVAAMSTEVLGNPDTFDHYVYANRFMWVDSRGILYFSAGNLDPQWWRGDDPSVFDHLYTYDPATGEFADSFPLAVATAIEVGQCTTDREHCYVMDDRGNLYRFDDVEPSFTHLGDFVPGEGSVWSLQLSPDEEVVYTFWGSGGKQLIQIDLTSLEATEIAVMSQLSTEMAGKSFVTGYDSWDNQGRFYEAGFTMSGGGNVMLMRVDPVRVKVALGLLPTLYEVSAVAGTDGVIISRTGGTDVDLDVLYMTEAIDGSGQVLETVYGSEVIPLGSEFVSIPASQMGLSVQGDRIRFSVRGDGNDYVLTDATSDLEVVPPTGGQDPTISTVIISVAGVVALVGVVIIWLRSTRLS